MKLEYYPIRGRGENGLKFQLARIQDENGNFYKGQFDQERHFSSEQELKSYLAETLKVTETELQLGKMSL